MELIFGLLPPPIALGLLGLVLVGGLLGRKLLKDATAKSLSQAALDTVVTKDRVDKAVEAVLVFLKVHPDVADKIGDLIADVVATMINQGRSVKAKASEIKPMLTMQPYLIEAAAAKMASATPLVDVMVASVDADIVNDEGVRTSVARAVVRELAMGTLI